MSFILVPNHGDEVQVNAWNWRPTLELLRSENLIEPESDEKMGAHGCGGQVSSELASRIANVLEQRLGAMRPGERMLANLSITAAPKKQVVLTAETNARELDTDDLYSATYEWLVSFRDFCRSSGGFDVT